MTLSPGFIEGIGGPELMMILFIILLLFGANRLPELARGFGKSMREFKKAANGVEEEFRRAMEESERAKPLPPPPAVQPRDMTPLAPLPEPPAAKPADPAAPPPPANAG